MAQSFEWKDMSTVKTILRLRILKGTSNDKESLKTEIVCIILRVFAVCYR